MKQDEAVKKATVFVLEKTGISAEPDSARLVERSGGRRYWSIVYNPELLCPREAARGATIDGPYVVRVDDVSGEVFVLG